MTTCGCGCGRETTIGKNSGVPNRFIHGHHTRVMLRKGLSDYPPPVLDPDSGCLRWQGTHHSQGYGIAGSEYAHRLVYERDIGPIPDGYDIDHVAARGCKYRDCVNPDHLEAVTHKVNVQRSARVTAQMERTECPYGHEYAGHNLIVRRGKRECRTCVYARNKRDRDARKAARQKAL